MEPIESISDIIFEFWNDDQMAGEMPPFEAVSSLFRFDRVNIDRLIPNLQEVWQRQVLTQKLKKKNTKEKFEGQIWFDQSWRSVTVIPKLKQRQVILYFSRPIIDESNWNSCQK